MTAYVSQVLSPDDSASSGGAVNPRDEDERTVHGKPRTNADPRGAGYHIRQSKIAVGSGGIWGSNSGSQTRQGFLPEPHTDFIYAVIGETYGFVGCALILSLYALLIWRGLHILTIAKNLFGALQASFLSAIAEDVHIAKTYGSSIDLPSAHRKGGRQREQDLAGPRYRRPSNR